MAGRNLQCIIVKIRAINTLATTAKLFLGPRASIPRGQKQRVRISLAVKMENGDLSQLVTL